jgi:diguanylate cyclase (GGDEF)-like protein/PAS domain S-box-containing protein
MDGMHPDLGRSREDPTQAVLLAAVPEAVLAVRKDAVIFANARAIALIGSDPSGTPIHDLLLGWAGEDGEAMCRRADGDLRVDVRVGPAGEDDAFTLLTLRDAAVRHQAEAARAEAEARYRALVEQVPAIAYIDKEGKGTVYVSPQIETIFGVSAEAYCADGELWNRLLHPEDRAQIEAEYDAFVEGTGGDLSDYRVLTPDGRTVWIRDRAMTVRDEHGRLLLEHGLMFDITELKEAEAEIAHLAYHDKLTGLPNRAMFEETLELSIARAARGNLSVAVLYLDLDNFKLVNDSLGHHAGDTLLQLFAERLERCTRDTDLVARQGGDEFLLLLSDIERGEDDDDAPAVQAVEIVARRVQEALREPFDLGGTEFYARGSIGVSLYPRDALDGTSLMKNADTAMYVSKRQQPGGTTFYLHGAGDAMARLSFATRLRRAVDEERWLLHYQPVVDLADGAMVGVEALIRWNDGNGGIVPPGEFIPVAEELGLIEAIGDWVIGEMAAQQRAWASAGLDIEVSFNLSPRQLWSPRLAQRILDKLQAAGVDPHRIVVEITESMAMAEPDRTQKVLAELHAWGLKLALDDFGTGYSSLARLKHMPVDVLKIDRAFVRNVHGDTRLAGMVRAMIQLAQSLDMVPLAEGIETAGELTFLRANGCRLAQGFHFARPVPAEQIPALAARSGGLIPDAAGVL